MSSRSFTFLLFSFLIHFFCLIHTRKLSPSSRGQNDEGEQAEALQQDNGIDFLNFQICLNILVHFCKRFLSPHRYLLLQL